MKRCCPHLICVFPLRNLNEKVPYRKAQVLLLLWTHTHTMKNCLQVLYQYKLWSEVIEWVLSGVYLSILFPFAWLKIKHFQPCVNLAPSQFLLKVATPQTSTIPSSEVAKDSLPAVTKHDKGAFADRVSLFLTKQSMSRKASFAVSRTVDHWKCGGTLTGSLPQG